MNIITQVRSGDPEMFVSMFRQAVEDLAHASRVGLGEFSKEGGRYQSYLSFFSVRSSEEVARATEAWRRLSDEQKRAYDAHVRWDLESVLYMLSDEMKQWSFVGFTKSAEGVIGINLEIDDPLAARGVIKQIIEYSGGVMLGERVLPDEDTEPTSWWSRLFR